MRLWAPHLPRGRPLDDLGSFANGLVPDRGVGVGEGSFGGAEPGGDRGPPLDGDGGAPALVEVADGEDTVFVASLGEGVLDFLEELRQPGRRDRGDRLAQSGQRQDGHGERASARVVEASGTYLVPGFCDMHAHPLNRKNPAASLDLMLAHGVTGFRQMYGSAQMLRDRAAGRLMTAGAPRLLALPGSALSLFNAGSAAAAVATVREQHELGADFIKTALVTREVFYEAQNAAGRLGIPIAGHLPNPVNMARQPDVDILDHAATTFDQDAAALLAERFVRDGTWQVPTLIRSRTNYLCDAPAFGADPDLRYISAPTLRGWTKAAEKFARFPAPPCIRSSTNWPGPVFPRCGSCR
jgi:hypothetical protein